MKLINPEVRIENTSKCNSRCTICPRDKFDRPRVTMPIYHHKRLVRQAKKLGAEWISIFGFGEPLVDKNIAKKVKYCTDLGLKTFITTNVSLLNTNKAFELIEAGLTKIRFSIHGTYDNYEKVHRGLKWDTVLRNVQNFVAINQVKFDHRTQTAVSIIPPDGDWEYYVNFWWKLFDEIEVWRPHNWVYGKNFREVKRRKKTCGRPFNGPIQINSDGSVMVCCFDFNGRMTVGNTYEQQLEDIIKGYDYNQIRDAHLSGSLKGLPCEYCDQLNEYKESPLLYSSVDPSRSIDKTSSTKFNLKEKENGNNVH